MAMVIVLELSTDMNDPTNRVNMNGQKRGTVGSAAECMGDGRRWSARPKPLMNHG
ncbi:hypothetical protein MVI01_61740 [Myxococcus virescens]|uniref:Uncharacterized protein n=1 Tax=Myxococcus virescens TaxID=83456 RepID=A0A511HLD7_9BACT|nr:hypothetical protein MVI01_61740 [Myxococcus virescens]